MSWERGVGVGWGEEREYNSVIACTTHHQEEPALASPVATVVAKTFVATSRVVRNAAMPPV